MNIDNSIIDFCKQLELYIQSDYYKFQIAIGAFSTRFNKFLLENERAKDHLFMIDVLKGEQSEKEKLQDEIDDLRIDIKELVSVLELLYEEANELRIHTAEQFFIDWEDESIEGTKQFTKTLNNTHKTINEWKQKTKE